MDSSNNNDGKNKYTTSVEVMLSKENRKVYTGPFSDNYGNPNIKYYGYLLASLFVIFGAYFLATHKIKYSIFFLCILILGSSLNAIRFYYVNPLIESDSDATFLQYVIYNNIFNIIISVLALFYILFIRK